MKRVISIVVEDCGQCPYMEWQPNHGMSNHSGCSFCKQANRQIGLDNEHPPIPNWCYLAYYSHKL